jgi:phosphoglucosamine mutase
MAQEDEIEAVYRHKKFRTVASPGSVYRDEQAGEIYIERLLSMFANRDFNRDLKIVVDPGNGAAAGFASDLFSRIGLNVIPLNDKPDGNFPGRSSEPTGKTLKGTVEFLKEQGADLAVCFDGDADRVVFCDSEGFLGFTEMVAFISRLAIKKSAQKMVAATIEVGKLLDLVLESVGGEVVRGKVGDVHLAHLVRQHDAAIGVEDVGVYIMPQMGCYPESMFAAFTLLSEIDSPASIREFLREFPRFFLEKRKVPCSNDLKETTMERIKEKAPALDPNDLNFMDGIRLDFNDGWMLIRASGTEPVIRVMAESTSEAGAREMVEKGMKMMEGLIPAS